MVMAGDNEICSQLHAFYESMYGYFGPRGWWPGESQFEICVGAILTQSVSWKNVAKAIDNLKSIGLLDIFEMYHRPVEDIEVCIVPTLYYKMKARKLKCFVNHLVEKYNGDFSRMFNKSIAELRKELLGIYGIGPETADSIILYAAEKPIFVVDAYTRRIFSRLGFWNEIVTYEQMQEFFMKHLPPETQFYNEYHAQIVGVGNRFCSNKKPRCAECPISSKCKKIYS